MRILVFFDLPMVNANERKEYTKFRKFLIKNGFIMLQESVYTKLALNNTNVESIKKKLELEKPSAGLVQVLIITEKQFANMIDLVGKNSSKIDDTTERLIII